MDVRKVKGEDLKVGKETIKKKRKSSGYVLR